MERHVRLLAVAILCTWLAGCATRRRVDLQTYTGGNAFLFRQFQAFDGASGRPLGFADLVGRCRQADVVLFGEQHGDPVCNQLEAQLLHALLETRRPLMLAMEFLEADIQTTLDAYLTGRLDEPEFLQLSNQPESYLGTHRPLIELCRAARVPVLAANAPRRLVRDYRKSGLSFGEYRAGLDPADRRWLPVSNRYLAGPYRDRFAKLMKRHDDALPTTQPTSGPGTHPSTQPATMPGPYAASQPVRQVAATSASQPVTRPATSALASRPATMPAAAPGSTPATIRWQDFYGAQLLWDEAMAESLASVRERFPGHRLMLVVGVFHVAYQGGTMLKLRGRRPRDNVCTIAYRARPNGRFAFEEQDRGAGDIVIYGLTPPEPEEKTMPRPVKQPDSQPTASQPASAPSQAPTTSTAPQTGSGPPSSSAVTASRAVARPSVWGS